MENCVVDLHRKLQKPEIQEKETQNCLVAATEKGQSEWWKSQCEIRRDWNDEEKPEIVVSIGFTVLQFFIRLLTSSRR